MRIARLGGCLLAGLGLSFAVVYAFADPVSDTLRIDGEEIVTRAPAPEDLPYDEVLSGWLFREAETRAVQEDSFENPGMLAVERGEEIWETVDGGSGQSCASCHDDASVSMADVGATYPRWDAEGGKPINVELQINACRTENMGAEPYAFDDPDQVALTAFVKHQALGKPVDIDLAEGEMQAWWERGRSYYHTRFGQLDLSCSSCHEQSTGRYLRADHLSQGQVNGFPTYRFNTGGMVSLHNRFRGCVRDTRAEIPTAFSDELLALETYVTWRGNGLSVETPAVRQ